MPENTWTTVARPSPRILCIEDDAETAALLHEDLVDRGYRLCVKRNGFDGLAEMMATPPDLVLCDINMPQMSGFDVLERLRHEAPHLEQIPFVFLTALADRQNELRGRRLGADDYVVKPIDFEHLAVIIDTRLRRSGWGGPDDEPRLTEREAETLTWSARGKTSDEIAAILHLTRRTIDFHLGNVRAKLGVSTRTQAVAAALAKKLIRP